MGRYHQGGLPFLTDGAKQLHDLLPGVGIQVSRWLIGQDQIRFID